MSNPEHFLERFFYPESVAIVGASRNPRSVNSFLVAGLLKLGYGGRIYPVNPAATEIMGLRAYPSVSSIGARVDLAVISVPARHTLEVVRDCVAAGVGGVTIVSGGFSETGGQGQHTQDEIHRRLRQAGIRCIGPNALSPINSANNFIIGFGPIPRALPRGGLSLIFQSGLYQPRLDWLLNEHRLNLAKLIDLGNKMDITETDALEYLAGDSDTKVIAIHTESIAGDARHFLALLRQTARRKPVIVLKSGRTEAGARAAASHTGAIASSDAVVDAALRQAGVIRASGLDEFFDLAKAFEYQPLPRGNRVAIASFSGGEGVLTTDACEMNGLRLAGLGEESYRRLKQVFPPWEIPLNPFDTGVTGQMTKDRDVVQHFVETAGQDPAADCLAVQLGAPSQITGQSGSDDESLVRPYTEAVAAGKTVVCWTVNPLAGRHLVELLESRRIPVFPSAERAIRALGRMWEYGQRTK